VAQFGGYSPHGESGLRACLLKLLNQPTELAGDFFEVAKSVGPRSGLRKMETWKSLRMIADKASALDTASDRIFLLLSNSLP